MSTHNSFSLGVPEKRPRGIVSGVKALLKRRLDSPKPHSQKAGRRGKKGFHPEHTQRDSHDTKLMLGGGGCPPSSQRTTRGTPYPRNSVSGLHKVAFEISFFTTES